MVVAAALLAGLLVITPWMVGSFYDDGTYLVLAKALASGKGYRYLNLPGAPEATHFPPAYPAFLALVLRITPDFATAVAVAKLANAALLPCAGLGAYFLCRRTIRWPAWPAAIAALVGVTAPAMLAMNAALMSETLFLAVLFPTLVLSERLVRGEGRGGSALIVGTLIGVLQLIRSIALPLLGAVLLVLVVRRRWRDTAVVLATAVAVVAPWLVWLVAHSGALPPALAANYGSYRDWIRQSATQGWLAFIEQVVRHNLLRHAMYIGDRFMPVAGVLPSKLAFGCFLVATAAAVSVLRRAAPVTLLFLAGYLALILTWPFPPDRFYYPLEPFLAVLVASAGVTTWSWWRASTAILPRLASVVGAAAVTILLGGQVRETVESVEGRRWERQQRLVHLGMAPVVGWIRAHTPPDAVVGTDVDPMVYLYADRRTVPLVNFRAGYYLAPPSDDALSLVQDTRALLTGLRPGYAVLRAAAPQVRHAVVATLPSLPVVPVILDTLPIGGVVLKLRWVGQPGPR